MAFCGFPRRVRYTPVPSPLFGPLLEQIDDLNELKCTLRLVWLLHQKRGYPRFVTLTELLADRTLSRAMSPQGSPNGQDIQGALALAVTRGTLITAALEKVGGSESIYMLNTESDRNALSTLATPASTVGPARSPEPLGAATERPNIFAMYEDNIGMLSPMIAEELREAEQIYPAAWIEDAFKEAVSLNKRSWRYVARILERWEQEGRSDGEPGRYPKKAGRY